MEEAILARLLADPGVSALVADRAHLSLRPETGALPAVVLHRISGADGSTFSGPDGLSRGRIQCDCWSRTWLEAKSLARTVRAAVAGAPFVVAGVEIQGVFVIDERDAVEIAPAGTFHRTSLDLQVWQAQA